MRLRDYLRMVWWSLNPNKHSDMVQYSFFDLFKYFFFVIFLGILASVLILVPIIAGYQNDLNTQLQKFGEFQIDLKVDVDEPVNLLKLPAINVDLNRENLSNEFMLINNNSVIYKKYIFFGEERISYADYQSVESEESSSLYSRIFIFLLPALLFWIVSFFVVKYAILISIFGLLGFVFYVSRKNEVLFKKSMKTAIFTATPMILIDLIFWPIRFMIFIPHIVYLIYFIIGLMMISDRKFKHKQKEEKSNKKFKY